MNFEERLAQTQHRLSLKNLKLRSMNPSNPQRQLARLTGRKL